MLDKSDIIRVFYTQALTDPSSLVRRTAVMAIGSISSLDSDEICLSAILEIMRTDQDESVRATGVQVLEKAFAYKYPVSDVPSSVQMNFNNPVYGVSGSTGGGISVASPTAQSADDIYSYYPEIIFEIVNYFQVIHYQNSNISLIEAINIIEDYFKDFIQSRPSEFEELKDYMSSFGRWEGNAKDRIQEVFKSCAGKQLINGVIYQATLDFIKRNIFS